MLKAAKIESNLSKFPDSSCQNIDQVNLLVEFIRENNSNKNDNCSHNCQKISSQLIFERMILNHYWIKQLKTIKNLAKYESWVNLKILL